jgi:hypothetical protein
LWQVVSEQAGLGTISNCRLETDGVVGGNLTVSFDFPVNLAVPFPPSPPSWREGTARASMHRANAVQRRQASLRRALPDSIDLLTICVEARLGFDAALAQASKNTTGPLAEELYRTLQEVQLGRSRNEAMRNLAARCDVPELSAFVLAMVQADVFGVSVAGVLRIQAGEMRSNGGSWQRSGR